MLRALIQTRLQSLFSSMFRRMGTKKMSPAKAILMVLLVIYVVGALFLSFGGMFYTMVEPFHMAGLDWLYFALVGIMGLVFALMGSVFATQSTLFTAKDNELLLSMPIPPSYILASRMVTLLILNYMYSFMLMIPAYTVWIWQVGIDPGQAVILVIASLLLPLISLALSCVLGWLVGLITARMRRKNLFSTLLAIVFFGLYFVGYSNLHKYLNQLLENGAAVSEALRRSVPPFYFFGGAIAETNWLYMLYTALICILPMVVLCWLLSKSLFHILTTQRGTQRVEYREKSMQVNSAGSALLKKELNRFFRTPMYMLNSGIGAVMLLFLAGALVVKGPSVIESVVVVPQMADAVPGALAAILGFSASLICTTAPSISLEGRSLWVLKSSPVTPRQVFHAKLGVNLIIGIPACIIAAAAAACTVSMSVMQMVILFLLPCALVCFSALLGLIANLYLPRFEWVSEMVVIKQSGSAMIAVLGGMAVVMLPVILYVAVLHKHFTLDSYLLLWLGIFALLCAGLYGHLMKKGRQLYENM